MSARRADILLTGLLAAAVAGAVAAAPARADVVFSSNRCVAGGCATGIWTVDDEGRGLRRVTDGGPPSGSDGQRLGNEADLQPSWSPLAARVVFARYGGHGAQSALYTVARDGTDERRLSPVYAAGAELQENWPDWSPAGGLIAYASNRAADSGPGGSRRIWVSAPDGALPRPITPDGGWAHLPRFTPDGLHVMYSDLGASSRLMSVPVAGGTPSPVVAGDLAIGPFALTVSPGGRTLAASMNGPDGPGLYLLDAAAGTLRKVSDGMMAGASWSSRGPALISNVLTGPFTSTVVRLDLTRRDAPARALTDGTAFDQTPDWGTTDPLRAIRDLLPPVTLVVPAPAVAAQAARAGRARPAARLRFAAVDPSGVRRVRAAIARRAAGSRCRFLVSGRLAAASRCSRPRWFAARSPRAWRRATRGLARGRYRVWIRARDGAGNVARRRTDVRLR